MADTETQGASQSTPQTNQGESAANAQSKPLSTNDAAALFSKSLNRGSEKANPDGENETQTTTQEAKKDPKSKKGKPKANADKDDNTFDGAENPDGDDEFEEIDDIDADDEDDQDGQPDDDDDVDDVENDGTDDDESDDEDTDDDSEDENDKGLHTVIVNGKEVEVTLDELKQGYSRTADYQNKTAKLAQERRELQAREEQIADLPQAKELYENEAQRFGKNAQLILTAFQNGFLPQEPTDELRQTNPAEYVYQKEKRQEAIQFMQGLEGEMQKYQAQQKDEHNKLVQKGRAQLLQAEPELQSADTRGKFQKYISDMGYTDDQIKNEADHRLFQMAFKAMKYDEMQERAKTKPAPERKRPKVIKQKRAREDRASIVAKNNSVAVNRHKTENSLKSASDLISQKISNAQRGKR